MRGEVFLSSDPTLDPVEEGRLARASLLYAAAGGAVRWETDAGALCIFAIRPDGTRWQAAAAMPDARVESPVAHVVRRERRLSALYAAATGTALPPAGGA
jgi:hypothetical protein